MKKLFKYDFKALKLPYLLLIPSSFIAAVFGAFMLRFWVKSLIGAESEIESGLSEPVMTIGLLLLPMLFALAVFVICAVFFLFNFFSWARYYSSLYSDEGKLTFMLPVKRSTLVNEKIIFGFISSFTGLLVMLISFAIMLFLCIAGEENAFTVMGQIWNEMDEVTDMSAIVIQLITTLAISTLYNAVVPLACVTVASLLMKRMKVFFSILLYVGINMVGGFVVAFAWILGTIFSMSSSNILIPEETGLDIALVTEIILYVALTVISIVLIHVLNKKKLNLTA